MTTIKTLIINFKNRIYLKDVPLFRGAIINSLDQSNILFHNHTESGYRYSYPLIQYKRIGGCATIVCIGEGIIEALAKQCRDDVIRLANGRRATVHVMGEMTLTYKIINLLKENDIKCLASTTERISVEKDGCKTSQFEFVRFREYL